MLFVEKYRHLFDLVEINTDPNEIKYFESTFLRVKIDEKNLSKEVLVEMFDEMKLLKKSNVQIELIITSK